VIGRTGGSEQKGNESVLKRRWQYTQNNKTRKRQERTERNVKKDRVDKTEMQFHKSLN
jgi:hypothetical protein